MNLAADACHSATVLISLNMDYAQDEGMIKRAANMSPGFDSIMVDMSHYDKEENLERTARLVNYCNGRGISTEAEPGRIEGQEDGIADTAELEGVQTTPEEALQFCRNRHRFLGSCVWEFTRALFWRGKY